VKGIDLSTLRERHVVAAGLVACAVLTLAAYVVVIEPTLDSERHLAQAQARLDSAQKEDKRLSDQLEMVRGQIGQVRQDMARTVLKLQPARHVNKRLARIEDMAAASGLELAETKLGEISVSTRYRTVPVQLVGTGSYAAQADFLHAVCEELSDTAVWTMNLTRNEDQAGGPTRFNIGLVWFVAPATGREAGQQ